MGAVWAWAAVEIKSVRSAIDPQDPFQRSFERKFSDFVASIGNSNCYDVDGCLRGPGNPYRDSDPVNYSFKADCADWPYVLRAYFARQGAKGVVAP